MRENLFRAELAKNGLTIPGFADKLGVHKSTIYRWFSNPECISLANILKFREILNVSDDDLLKIFFAHEVL